MKWSMKLSVVVIVPSSLITHDERIQTGFFSQLVFTLSLNWTRKKSLQIVTPKRAAMLLDRIMVALHHALEDTEDGTGRKINDVYRDGGRYGAAVAGTKAGANGKPLYHAASAGKFAIRPYAGHKVQQLSDDDIMGAEEYDDISEKVLEDRSLGENEEDIVERDNTVSLEKICLSLTLSLVSILENNR